MLPAGVPGTGHILVFDNGNNSVNYNPRKKDGRPNSRVVEINPLDNSIAWQYTAEMSNRPTWSFFSHYISSAQRQPNGNTLICEGSNGRFFEVTPSGEIVWEYINPFPNLSGQKSPKVGSSASPNLVNSADCRNRTAERMSVVSQPTYDVATFSNSDSGTGSPCIGAIVFTSSFRC
jgi:hypothetical protein